MLGSEVSEMNQPEDPLLSQSSSYQGLTQCPCRIQSGVSIAGGELIFNPTKNWDSGAYTCIVKNKVGSEQATASLTVQGKMGMLLYREYPIIGDSDYWLL